MGERMETSEEIVWAPSAVDETNIHRFMQRHRIDSYEALLSRSTEDIRWFWKSALEDLGLEWFTPYQNILEDSAGFPWCKWFVGGELNIVHNCLDRHVSNGLGDKTAFFWEADSGKKREISYREWAEGANRVAATLLKLGVHVGDRVGLYMPMIPEMVFALFGAFKIGAVVVPVFSGFGPQALAVRLTDAHCKVLLTADGGERRGSIIDLKALVDEALEAAPCVKSVVVKRHVGNKVAMKSGRDCWWEETVDRETAELPTVVLPAEAPALVIYTSGTTGRPKGTVHTHAGCLAQMAKEVGYCFDVKPDSRFFWVTDIGWMMGPWEIIGVSFFGATFGIYEGAPDYPEPDRLWRMVDAYGITHLGISPTLIRVLKKAGEAPLASHSLATLRYFGSTGEPWDPDSYLWLFEKVGRGKVPIMNISGGTEIVGCLLAPLPIRGLKVATLQGPSLGMDVDVWNEAGESVRGEVGYLVCKQPAPSMTKGFLNDPDRYLETYFSKWPGVWNHGDWAYVDADGFWFIRGRADDTIKVAGKRTGPAEIESALCAHADFMLALYVTLSMWAFVCLILAMIALGPV